MELLFEECKPFLDQGNTNEEEEPTNNTSEKKPIEQDCRSMLQQVNAEEKELRNKRRWLLGLQTYEDDEDEHEDEDGDGDESEDDNEDEDVEGCNVETKWHPIPESLLREDDVSYEIIKSLVEHGVCTSKTKYHMGEDELQLVHSPEDVKDVLHLIKDMTNQGLDRFARALTSLHFEKTRWKMTQVIKQCLLSSNKRGKIKLSEDQSAVLKNPHNYRWSSGSRFIPAGAESSRAAIYKILDALEALSTPALYAMHRKIKGTKGYIPQLQPPKRSGWGRATLIKNLRKTSLKLLSGGDSLPEPLAKAMDVAGLNLKLINGCEYATNFIIQPSRETNTLQNEIAECIKLLERRVESRVLTDIQKALNTNEKIADKSLRTLVRNLLTSYLCECSDMEKVPECLHRILAIIKKSCKSPPHPEKMEIENAVESVLSVSASMKQLVWDLIALEEDGKLDQEFAEAYMEDLQDSDDEYADADNDNDDNADYVGDNDDDNDDGADVVAENDDDKVVGKDKVNFSLRIYSMPHQLVSIKTTQQQLEGHNEKSDDQTSMCENNQYLAVQAATDEASIVAYRLLDHILHGFAQTQADSSLGVVGSSKQKKRKATNQEEEDEDYDSASSVVLEAVEELLPLYAKRCEGLNKLKSR